MKEVLIQTLPTLPDFDIAETEPDYWQQRWAYEQCLLMWNLKEEGFALQEVEEVDLLPISSSIDTTLAQLTAWWDAFLIDKSTTLAVNLIDLAPVISTIASGGADSVIGVLLGHCVNLMVTQSQRGGQSDGGNLAEVERLLKLIYVDNADTPEEISKLEEIERLLKLIYIEKADTPEEYSKLDAMTGAMPNTLHVTIVNDDSQNDDTRWNVIDE